MQNNVALPRNQSRRIQSFIVDSAGKNTFEK
jgi:hypothetical protein